MRTLFQKTIALHKLIMALSTALLPVVVNAENPEVDYHDLSRHMNQESAPFFFGVASGDPLKDRVIIWTHISPEKPADNELQYDWQVAKDSNFSRIIQSGSGATSRINDFTAKVDVKGLEPGETYYYRFIHNGENSPVGRTRTLPAGKVNQTRLAVVVCTNYQHGYFNAYADLADRKNIDAVIHLGDTIYEYGLRHYMDRSHPRAHVPHFDIVSLKDYRTRHAQYRLEKEYQAAAKMHPFIYTWDDHEFADNSWINGSLNHDPETQGNWSERREAAHQAFFEWMPIRPNSDQTIHRDFQWGDLVHLLMLDARLDGRSQGEPPEGDLSYKTDPDRTILGFPQKDWINNQLKDSDAKWTALGTQVPFTPMVFYPEDGEIRPRVDQWDGYPMSRKRVINILETNSIDRPVFLSGDLHSSYIFEPVPNTNANGIEINVPALCGTTPGYTRNAGQLARMKNFLLNPENNPGMLWADLANNGYGIMTFQPDYLTVEIVFTLHIEDRDPTCFTAVTYVFPRSHSSGFKLQGN